MLVAGCGDDAQAGGFGHFQPRLEAGDRPGGEVELEGEGEGILVHQHRETRRAGNIAGDLNRHGGPVLGDFRDLEKNVAAGFGAGGTDQAQGIGGGFGVEGGAVEVDGQGRAGFQQTKAE